MAFSRSVFVLLVLNVVFCYANIPVFLWGDLDGKAPKSNPITTINEEEFKGIASREFQGDPLVAVFVDASLSVEDLSLKNSDGDTVFPYLHANIGNALYLPSVENPVASLHSIADPKKVHFVTVTDEGLSPELNEIKDGIVFISFRDAHDDESRAELLRRHNDLIEETVTELQQNNDKVVAVYTANYPSWVVAHSRARRQAVENSTSDYNLSGLRLYVSKLELTVGNGQAVYLDGLSGSTTNFNNSEMNTELNFGTTSLTLNFLENRGYWFFESVLLKTDTIEQLLQGDSDVHALMGFSYRCGQNVTFSGGNDTRHATLQFQNLKVQPFFTETNGSVEFGESLNCVGFFTVPIWSGLLVTFVLLAITFYGIMMMMDIRTMDRFDDPKGKTITINAGE